MLRITLFVLAMFAGLCHAQETFQVEDGEVTSYDPMRDIIHVENIGIYPIPQDELTVDLELSGSVRWNKTLEWLGGDIRRRNKLTVLYQNPEDDLWYVVGKGFAAGAGVRFWPKWNGKYLVELRNPDHPIVVEVLREGDQITALAHVVYE